MILKRRRRNDCGSPYRQWLECGSRPSLSYHSLFSFLFRTVPIQKMRRGVVFERRRGVFRYSQNTESMLLVLLCCCLWPHCVFHVLPKERAVGPWKNGGRTLETPIGHFTRPTPMGFSACENSQTTDQDDDDDHETHTHTQVERWTTTHVERWTTTHVERSVANLVAVSCVFGGYSNFFTPSRSSSSSGQTDLHLAEFRVMGPYERVVIE